MTEKPDTAAIRALKSKRSKCADVGNIDLSNVPESHETIWLQWGDNGGDDDTWCADNINDDDVPYIRADLVFALCDKVDRLWAALDGLLAAVDEWAETPPGSDAEIAATGPISEAAETARAALAQKEDM